MRSRRASHRSAKGIAAHEAEHRPDASTLLSTERAGAPVRLKLGAAAQGQLVVDAGRIAPATKPRDAVEKGTAAEAAALVLLQREE